MEKKYTELELLKIVSEIVKAENIMIINQSSLTMKVLNLDTEETYNLWNMQIFNDKKHVEYVGYDLDFSVKGNPVRIHSYLFKE